MAEPDADLVRGGDRLVRVRHPEGESEYRCAPGDTLLRAALRAGIGLSYECNVGGCGSCKIELIEGELIDLNPQASGIRPRERERGRRLACQSAPAGDCTIKARLAPEGAPKTRPMRLSARFEGFRQITGDIRELRFRTGTPAEFQCGQYALLELDGLSRPYSMSNTPNPGGLWSFMVRRVPGGALSNSLFDRLQDGMRVQLDAPYGLAYLRKDSPRPVVCIAGGSGLAPIVSILAGMAEGSTEAAPIHFFYGGRGPLDIPALSELVPAEILERCSFHPCVSEPAQAETHGWCGDVGLVHALLPQRLSRPLADYDFYLAGPPPMIEAVVLLLARDNAVPQEQIRFDRFF